MSLLPQSRLLCVAAAVLAASCSDSSAPDGLSFPALSSTLRSQFCVRDNGTVGQQKSGSITDDDCDAADVDPEDSGFFEVYVVKVGASGPVTFSATSAFDNYLTLLSLDSFTETTAEVTFLADDDDSGAGLDARLTYTLNPATTYLIVVAGFDYSESGAYTLSIQ